MDNLPAPPVAKNKGGRPRGRSNKQSTTVKDALIEAFDQMGGVPALVKWGKTDPKEFYKIWVKILPFVVAANIADGGGGFSIVLHKSDPKPEPIDVTPTKES